MQPELVALQLTVELALLSTAIMLLIALPLSAWLARSQSVTARIVEAVIALPLVLPPTVLGFYLLIAFAPDGLIGAPWLQLSGRTLAFSFSGLVLGSVIYSLPFVVQPLQSAFERAPVSSLELAAVLGAGPLERLATVTLPLMMPSVLVAVGLGFAHTLGEFGVALMIGGNIPGETQVLSIALYDRIEVLDYAVAHRLAAGLLIFSFMLMLLLYGGRRRFLLVRG